MMFWVRRGIAGGVSGYEYSEARKYSHQENFPDIHILRLRNIPDRKVRRISVGRSPELLLVSVEKCQKWTKLLLLLLLLLVAGCKAVSGLSRSNGYWCRVSASFGFWYAGRDAVSAGDLGFLSRA
jgi:hypothetical protein